MKKAWIAAAFLIALTGCASYSADYQTLVNERIAAVQALPAAEPKYTKAYYSYYIEPSVGRIDSDATSNTFSLDGTRFIMDLNVSGIINSQYYQDADSRDSVNVTAFEKAAHSEGTYTDYAGNELPFSTDVYMVEGSYFVIFHSAYMEFYAVSDELQSADLIAKMLEISRTVKVKEDAVTAAFSSRQTISNTRKKLELFQNLSPVNGSIEELLNTDQAAASATAGTASGNNYATDNYQDAVPSTPSPESTAAAENNVQGDTNESADQVGETQTAAPEDTAPASPIPTAS